MKLSRILLSMSALMTVAFAQITVTGVSIPPARSSWDPFPDNLSETVAGFKKVITSDADFLTSYPAD